MKTPADFCLCESKLLERVGMLRSPFTRMHLQVRPNLRARAVSQGYPYFAIDTLNDSDRIIDGVVEIDVNELARRKRVAHLKAAPQIMLA